MAHTNPTLRLLLAVLLCGVSHQNVIQGDWSFGMVTEFMATTGHFNGTVCVSILTPAPSCGWRVEMYFYDAIRARPNVLNAVFDFELSSMTWFEFVNMPHNGDLRNNTPNCLHLALQGETDETQPPLFDARMACACYNV